MAPLIAIGIQAIPELIRLGQGLLDSYNNGTLTQEEFNQRWDEMRGHVVAAEAKWEAAGKDE